MSTRQEQLRAPTTRTLRQFAALWIVFFGLIAAVQDLRHGRHNLALALVLLAATIGPLGLVWPHTIRPIFVGWTALARPIGRIVSGLILGLMFYGLFTPVALIFRMMRRDALGLKRQADATSYWRTRPRARDSASYLRQF